MEKELINAWLVNQNYQIGVEIYKRLGSNNFLKILFTSGESTYNLNRLKQELKQLNSSFEAVQPPVLEEKLISNYKQLNEQPTRDRAPSELDDAPSEIKAAIEKRKNFYAEARVLKNALADEDNQDIRAKSCLKILMLFRQINELWELTNYFDQHQKLPPVIEKIEIGLEDESSVVLNAKWMNHYKYLKKFIDDSGKKEKLLQRYQEAKQIERILLERDAYQYSRLVIPIPI